jgi:hypothetical protein
MMILKDIGRILHKLIRRTHGTELARGSSRWIGEVSTRRGDVWVQIFFASHASRRVEGRKLDGGAVDLLTTNCYKKRPKFQPSFGGYKNEGTNLVRATLRQDMYKVTSGTSISTSQVGSKGARRHYCWVITIRIRGKKGGDKGISMYNVMTNENKNENKTAAISAVGDMAATAL